MEKDDYVNHQMSNMNWWGNVNTIEQLQNDYGETLLHFWAHGWISRLLIIDTKIAKFKYHLPGTLSNGMHLV